MHRARIGLSVLIFSLFTACHHGRLHTCIENAVCDTGDPCTHGETVCGADDTAHCVVKRVETVLPQCPPRPPGACVPGARCDTGNPCLVGETICGADGVSHCVVIRVEDIPACD